MIIKKFGKGIVINLNEEKIFIDTGKIEEGINILTDIRKDINYDKIFNLPGEFDTKNTNFKLYKNNEYLVSVFGNKEIKLIYSKENIKDEILKEIFNEFGEINIGIFDNVKNWEEIKNMLKLKIIIDLDGKLKIKGKKEKEIKINLKKIVEENYILTNE